MLRDVPRRSGDLERLRPKSDVVAALHLKAQREVALLAGLHVFGNIHIDAWTPGFIARNMNLAETTDHKSPGRRGFTNEVKMKSCSRGLPVDFDALQDRVV